MDVADEFDVGASAIDAVTLRIPVGPIPQFSYLAEHVDLQLSPMEARGFRRLTDGVLRAAPKLANGRTPRTGPDTLRYVLQLIEAAAVEAGL